MKRDIITIIESLLKFRYPQICRHHVALELLNLLEQHGVGISEMLTKSVIEADDDTALFLLKVLKGLGDIEE